MDKHWYTIKKPQGRRKSFAIQKTIKDPTGARSFETISLPEINSINNSYLAKTISHEKAFEHFQDLVSKLYKERDKGKGVKIFGSVNLGVFEKYWEERYQSKTKLLKDPNSMRHDLRRAVEAVGNLPLISATKAEIESSLDHLEPNNTDYEKFVNEIYPFDNV